MLIGTNLKQIMGDISPADLHRMTGVPAMTIGRILKGEVSPQIDTLHKLAKGLNVPLALLVCDDELLKEIIKKLSSMSRDELKAVKTILKI